jgi:hypothetical protein
VVFLLGVILKFNIKFQDIIVLFSDLLNKSLES